MALPKSGDLLHLTRAASVQFAVAPTLFRVIRVLDWSRYDDGYVWLDGYQLDGSGSAVERRSVYVRVDGIRSATALPSRPRAGRR